MSKLGLCLAERLFGSAVLNFRRDVAADAAVSLKTAGAIKYRLSTGLDVCPRSVVVLHAVDKITKWCMRFMRGDMSAPFLSVLCAVGGDFPSGQAKSFGREHADAMNVLRYVSYPVVGAGLPKPI